MNEVEIISLVDRVACPLCKSTAYDSFISFPDIPVVRCKACGFLYSSKLMHTSELSRYYSEGFGSERHRKGQYINAVVNAVMIKRLLPIHDIDSFLDVGAGYGYLLKQMNKLGVKSTGVELSRIEAQYGQQHLNANILNCSLGQSGLMRDSFDLVACFEVIEHIPEPRIFMNELINYVKPGGYILVMTDNFNCSVAKELGAGFPKWIPHSHISHFSPDTLENLFLDSGVEIVGRLSYTPWELLIRQFYTRIRGKNISPESAFNLSSVMSSEMNGDFLFYGFRRLINSAWAQLTAKKDLNGALMYLLARRQS